ncbi:MFS transporter [Photobacterium profundum]|uniref:Multidrug resistance protein, putative n=1 Tax=Photobacterium profundum 3TCK TaxID=314280 RepID=Q1Z6A6_9GAMM|nr:MFS transporter [Photobacterium profundum]EAS43938.1 multidrug resistance protein, putative [Photobacterium profundum 3TCK]PSV61864.1 MFS transporter [Photobacterium profundum]
MNIPRRHFQIMNLGHALNHYFILIFPTAVLGLQEHWNLDYAELLRLGSFGILAYGLGSFPAGWLGDHWSKKAMINVFFYGMGLSGILTAFTQTPEQLVLGVVAIGLFASIYHPVGLAIIFSTAEKTGRAIAINGLAGNIGLACAAVATAYLTQVINWQVAFLIPGIICIISGVLYTWVSKDILYIQKPNANKKSEVMDNISMRKLFIAIAVIATFGGLVFQTLTTVLPKVLQITFDTSLGNIGLLATSIFIVAAITQLIVGELLERLSARALLLNIVMAQTGFLLLASIASGWMLVLCLTGLIFSTYAQIPINDWLIGKYAADQWRSRLYAVKYMLSFSTGPIAYWLIANIYDQTGEFTLLYWLLAAVMILSVLAVWVMPNNKHNKRYFLNRH